MIISIFPLISSFVTVRRNRFKRREDNTFSNEIFSKESFAEQQENIFVFNPIPTRKENQKRNLKYLYFKYEIKKMKAIYSQTIEGKLKELFPIAVRLIHYIGLEDCDYVYEVNMNFNTSIDTILNTRCGSTFNTIKFLLNLSPVSIPINNLTEVNIDYAYRVELIGYNEDRTDIETGHVFLLIWFGNWFMVDSYFADRTLTIDSINPSELDVKVRNLVLNFSQELWKDVTYHDSNIIPDGITVSIDTFKFDSANIETLIDKRFKELVLLALEHLKTDIGQSDEYVAILGLPEVDVDLAEEYLMSLLQ